MYQQNTSQVVGFSMVTTAGLADSTATLGIAANRIIENGALQSCVGVVINKTQGAWVLVMDSSDCNGKQITLLMTAPGDVPLAFTFPTTTANPHDAVAFGLSRLDSNISSRMGATPLINNLSNLDSAVSSRMGTFTLPTNFQFLGLSSTGHVSNVDTLQIYTSNTPQSGDAFARVGVAGAGLTALGDTRIAFLDSNVSSRMGTFGLPGNFSGMLINASGQVTAASIAAGGIGLTAFTTGALNGIADALLDRDMSAGTDSGTETNRTPRQAFRTLRNKVDIITGKVYKEDDNTESYTFSTTTQAGNPIVTFDPTG